MKTYELLSIIKPNIDSEEYDKIVAKIDETIVSLDGKVVTTDKMGRKKLSYDIKDYRDGYLRIMLLEISPVKA